MKRSATQRRTRAMTMLEVLMVIGIVGFLVSLILPVLGEARARAFVAVSSGNQHQIYVALMAYSEDNNSYTPHTGGYSGRDVPYVYNGFEGAVGGPSMYGPFPGAGGANRPMGLGNLPPAGSLADTADWVSEGTPIGDYLSMETLFAPSDRDATRISNSIEYPSWWALREYFGDKYAQPWSQDGLAWGFWDGGGNYHHESSYMWRGADYNWIDDAVSPTRTLSHQIDTNTFLNGSTNAARVIPNMVRARTDHIDFTNRYILMEKHIWLLNPGSPQVNALSGDGSVETHAEEAFLAEAASPVHLSWYTPANFIANRYFAALEKYGD